MPGRRRIGCCRGDEPKGVASALADSVKEAGISIAGTKDAMEDLFDGCGDDSGVIGVGGGLHGGDRSVAPPLIRRLRRLG
jgi:hypothetical protein